MGLNLTENIFINYKIYGILGVFITVILIKSLILYFYDRNIYLQTIIDSILFQIKSICDQNIENKEFYFPILLTVFNLVLLLNVLGSFGFFALNAYIIFPAILSFLVFFIAFIIGFKEKKLKLFSDLIPNNIFAPFSQLIFLIELISLIFKPIALFFRLFLNIKIGHEILDSMYSSLAFKLQSVIVSLPMIIMFNIVELISCVVQAYVFTLFSAILIGTLNNKKSH